MRPIRQRKRRFKLKQKEEILREEIRSIRDIYVKIFQWSVLILISTTAGITYSRRGIVEILQRLKAGHYAIKPIELTLPILYFIFGNIMLLLITLLLFYASNIIKNNYINYVDQLSETNLSGITDLHYSKLWWNISLLYFIFPIADLINIVAVFFIFFNL